MKILKEKITIAELEEMAQKMFNNLVKAVVDVEQEIMAVDGELHSDLEELLIKEKDSKPYHCWGINLHPQKTGDDFIEFDSMINVKPAFNNRSRGVEDEKLREKIKSIVKKYAT